VHTQCCAPAPAAASLIDLRIHLLWSMDAAASLVVLSRMHTNACSWSQVVVEELTKEGKLHIECLRPMHGALNVDEKKN